MRTSLYSLVAGATFVASALVLSGCPEKAGADKPVPPATGGAASAPGATAPAAGAPEGKTVKAGASPFSDAEEKKFAGLFVRLIQKKELSSDERKALAPLMNKVSADLRPAPTASPEEKEAAAEKMKERLFSIVDKHFPEQNETLRNDMKRFECESYQSEARSMLMQIGKIQMGYHKQKKTFSKDIAELKLEKPPGARYEYSVTSADAKQFKVSATGKAGTPVAGDVWTVNEKAMVEPANNICAQPK